MRPLTSLLEQTAFAHLELPTLRTANTERLRTLGVEESDVPKSGRRLAPLLPDCIRSPEDCRSASSLNDCDMSCRCLDREGSEIRVIKGVLELPSFQPKAILVSQAPLRNWILRNWMTSAGRLIPFTAIMSSKTTLKVWRGAKPDNAYVWSPFVTKLEARLRFANVRYDLGAGSPKSAPRGKIPYITLEDGTQFGDSTFIIKSLVASGQLPDLNEELRPAQRAQDLATRALLEDRWYFYHGREKWCDNYETMRDGVLAPIPWPIRYFIGILAHKAIVRTLYGQGTLRFDEEELTTLRDEVWKSINAMLDLARSSRPGKSDEPFWVLGGPGPTEADATMFGFVVGALICDA